MAFRRYKEERNKYWAFSPKPGEPRSSKFITAYNLGIIAQQSIVGIGPTKKLAKLRRDERVARLGDQAANVEYHAHVYDAENVLGAVAIIGSAVREAGVPKAWHVEAYAGDAVEPVETHMLAMEHVIGQSICTDESLRLKAHLENVLQELKPGHGPGTNTAYT